MSQIKGINLTHTRAFIESVFAFEGWASVAAEMSPAARAASDGLVTIGWYPAELHVEWLRAMEVALVDREKEIVVRAGAFAAEYDVRRIHRILFRALDPGLLLEKAMEIWDRYYDSGRWLIERPAPNSAIGTLLDFGIVDARYCRYLGGYLQRLFELVGAHDVRVRHLRCRARGDSACRFDAEWR